MGINFKVWRFLMFTAVFWCMLSCHPKVKDLTDFHASECIYFGKGGGFTGQLFEYFICKNGIILKKNNGELKFFGKIPSNISQQVFTNYDMLQIHSLKINNPGNAYYFIGYQQNGQSIHKITWGNDPVPNKEITLFFNMMLDIIKKFAAH